MFGKTLVLGLTLLTGSLAAASDLSLEPCVNGGVSTSGIYPSQAMERQIHAYLNWRSYQPYYLFAVSANYIEAPFDAGGPAPDHN